MTDTTALDTGLAAADGPEKARERADVRRWQERIEQARKFDEAARKQYARDRRYARGDSGFDVDANIIGTFIDILESFYYAKDPDVDILPAKAIEPPSIDAVRDMVEYLVANDPATQAQIQQQVAMVTQAASWAALAQGQNPGMVVAQAQQEAQAQIVQGMVQQKFEAMQAQFAERQRNAKAYAETLEIVMSRLWKDGGLKSRGRKMTRSALTIGVGVLKAFWDERTAPSPETIRAIADLQDNIKRAAAQRAELDEASGADLEAKQAEYQRQIKALQGETERVIARGFAIDAVRGEDLQVAPGYAISDYLDAPWICHRIPMPSSEAMAITGLTSEKMAKATRYSARKPEGMRTTSAMVDEAIEATDADAYLTTAASPGATTDGGEYVMLLEIWDRTTNTVLTGIEGLMCWVKPAWQPKPTTRFYPFFLLPVSDVDGERHPQSLVTRSMKLADEYNRIGSAEREHRLRVRPKIMFHKGTIGGEAMNKVVEGATGEFVGVETTSPNVDLRTLFVPVQYPALDPALYDRSRIMVELERIWGVQEALSGGIQTVKTATEAEIQQGGFQARTSGRRDMLDAVLQELAVYTAEVARAHLTAEDVRRMAGPDAMWPPYGGAEELNTMVSIEIRAGSSGKPNTTADRQSWAQIFPVLTAGVDKIGMLRNSLPTDVADCHENLLRLTAERSGDRLDIDQLVPKPGPAPMPMDPAAAPAADSETPDSAPAAAPIAA